MIVCRYCQREVLAPEYRRHRIACYAAYYKRKRKSTGAPR